ncbi:MAG: flagellar basal body-associated FliL family protein [Campylobacterota bacterium]|nr:flagellar basal body-associated FliL family protein [Campylobacterota bacterium]
MSYLIKEVKVDHSKSLPQKAVSKGPGYHRVPIIDWQDKKMVHLGDFTTNTTLTGGHRRFVKTKITVRTSNEDVSEELKLKNVLIRDSVIKAMSSKRFDEIGTAQGKLKLKEEIAKGINRIVKEGEINEVYFTEFIVQ